MSLEWWFTQNREIQFTSHVQTAASIGFCRKLLVCVFSIQLRFYMVCDLIGMDGVKTLVMYNLPVETRCYLPCVFSSSFALTCWSSSTLLSCCNLATFKLAFCCIQGSYPFSETNFQDFSRTQIDFSRLQNSH